MMTPNNRLQIKTAVYVIFQKDNKILFLRRFNTGWSDGLFTLPAGHIDPGELPLQTAVREANEEVNLTINMTDLEFVHVSFIQDEYIDFYFKAKAWQGTEDLVEKEKADGLAWLNLEADSSKIIPTVVDALRKIQQGEKYSQRQDK